MSQQQQNHHPLNGQQHKPLKQRVGTGNTTISHIHTANQPRAS